MNQNEVITKLFTLTNFEFLLCERKSGVKFIKVTTYCYDADGYIEVARINNIKSDWNRDGEYSIEHVFGELKGLSDCANQMKSLAQKKELKLV